MAADQRRVIFLDVDGVLNSSASVGMQHPLEDDLVEKLGFVVNRTGADIVVSSTWRLLPEPLSALKTRLEAAGITVISSTVDKREEFLDSGTAGDPNTDYAALQQDQRVAEIREWVQLNADHIESWAAVDDMDLSSLGPQFVRTERHLGLQAEQAEALVALLGEREGFAVAGSSVAALIEAVPAAGGGGAEPAASCTCSSKCKCKWRRQRWRRQLSGLGLEVDGLEKITHMKCPIFQTRDGEGH